MAKFKRIFVHCSASPYGSALEIDSWHKARGWTKIGYHFVISNGLVSPNQEAPWGSMVGSLECGRPIDDDTEAELDEIGAHTFGFNSDSIGICLVGKHKFSELQIVRLRYLVAELQRKLKIPKDAVYGHYEAGTIDPKYATTKTCPNIPMHDFRAFTEDKMSLHALMQSINTHNLELQKAS